MTTADKMHSNGNGANGDGEGLWFDDARVIDDEWIEYSLTTPFGERAQYRIPRRTLFDEIDRVET